MNTLRGLLFTTVATAAVALTFAPLTLNAQPADSTYLAQMKHEDKGMQRPGGPSQMPGMQSPGQGSQMPGMQGQGMPAQPGASGGMAMPMMGGGMTMPMMGGGSAMPMMMCQGMMPGSADMKQQRMGDIPSDRIEGRIAFLRAELGITQAQTAAWDEVASALRTNAKRMSGAHVAQPQKPAMTSAERLEEQERLLSARLDSIRAVKPAYAKLYAVLDDTQKKNADELMAPYLGMM